MDHTFDHTDSFYADAIYTDSSYGSSSNPFDGSFWYLDAPQSQGSILSQPETLLPVPGVDLFQVPSPYSHR